jgi:hypothetical protein
LIWEAYKHVVGKVRAEINESEVKKETMELLGRLMARAMIPDNMHNANANSDHNSQSQWVPREDFEALKVRVDMLENEL